MKRIYISGPMTGKTAFGFPEFDAAARQFRSAGHEVFSPADNDRRILGKPADWLPIETDSVGPWKAWAIDGAPSIREMFGDDVAYICHHADAIAMLPGWEHSKGARAEHALALALGHEIIYL